MIPATRDPADTADLGAVPLGSPVPPEPGVSLSGTGFGTGPLGTGGPGANDLGESGLPQRVRQASLAAQLRETAAEKAPAQAADDFWTRSPEETRSTVTAIQRGWERGRSVFDVPTARSDPGAAPENGTENGADDQAENGATGTSVPGAGTAGATAPEQSTEDRGTSG
jgi:hypothetical protein